MPDELQHIDHHPLIKSCSQFITFKKMFQEKTTKFKDSYLRKLEFKIYDSKKNRTTEANQYCYHHIISI